MSIIEDKADEVLGRRVRAEREGRGWSLAELAGRAGVSKAMIAVLTGLRTRNFFALLPVSS